MGNRQSRSQQESAAVDKPAEEEEGAGVEDTSPVVEADGRDEATPNVAVLEVDQFDSDGKLVESAAVTNEDNDDQTDADDTEEVKTEKPEIEEKKEEEAVKEEVDTDDYTVSFDCGDFPFENVVLIGDRVRSVAYCGVVQLLEETKIWDRIKRISGCSAGALAAALLSVGYSGKDMEQFLTGDSPLSFQDRGWVDRIKPQQWNYAYHLYAWLGERIKEKADDCDATFLQVYKKFGKELCIVVTNLSQMTTEYFHRKTTPNIPIRLAVRMSMALPGRKRRKGKAIFQPVALKRINNDRAIFIDGSLLDKQPISCYDGWWLSMAHEDSYLKRLQIRDEESCMFNDDDKFSAYNTNTIGLTVYDRNELDSLRESLEQRVLSYDENKIPNTNISRRAAISTERCKRTAEEYTSLINSANKLLEAMKNENVGLEDAVTKTQFESMLEKDRFLSEDELKLLFNGKTSADEVMKLFLNDKGEFRYIDVINELERKAYELQQRCQAAKMKSKRKSAETFYRATLANVEKISRRDLDRTIGINTQYIANEDVDLEIEDVQFLIKQGRRATKAFLMYYGRKYVSEFDPDPPRPFHREELTKFIEDDLSEIIDIQDYNEDGSVRVRDK